MMQYIAPFRVANGVNTATLAVTASNQAVTLNARNGNGSIRIVNSGTQIVYFVFDATAAVATSVPVLPNTAETFFLSKDAVTINFIAGATGSTVYLTIGESA